MSEAKREKQKGVVLQVVLMAVVVLCFGVGVASYGAHKGQPMYFLLSGVFLLFFWMTRAIANLKVQPDQPEGEKPLS